MKKIIFVLTAVLCSVFTNAQLNISGTITGENDKPLSGAHVYLKNEFKLSITDENGKFLLENAGLGDKEVIIQYMGYQTEEKLVSLIDGEVTLNVKLIPVIHELQAMNLICIVMEYVTPVAHIEIKKEELQKNNLGVDLPYLLDQTPSVVVTSDAGAGVGYTGIRIRGTDPTRINATVNGIPLNDAESHGVWWVNMPDFASSVDDIQIQRGAGTSTNGVGHSEQR